MEQPIQVKNMERRVDKMTCREYYVCDEDVLLPHAIDPRPSAMLRLKTKACKKEKQKSLSFYGFKL